MTLPIVARLDFHYRLLPFCATGRVWNYRVFPRKNAIACYRVRNYNSGVKHAVFLGVFGQNSLTFVAFPKLDVEGSSPFARSARKCFSHKGLVTCLKRAVRHKTPKPKR